MCWLFVIFSPSYAKAACVLIDLCTGVLGPWMGQVIAKVDLAVDLIEDLLGVIHGARHALADARAALKYIVLALSGHMDDVMAKYKGVKHQILFLLEILEPLLDPALTSLKSTIAFGNVSPIFLDGQEQNCSVALNVIRAAVTKSAILPSLESEWRRGSVSPIFYRFWSLTCNCHQMLTLADFQLLKPWMLNCQTPPLFLLLLVMDPLLQRLLTKKIPMEKQKYLILQLN